MLCGRDCTGGTDDGAAVPVVAAATALNVDPPVLKREVELEVLLAFVEPMNPEILLRIDKSIAVACVKYRDQTHKHPLWLKSYMRFVCS